MLFIVQYTITDARRFTGHADAILPYPDWPYPQTNEFAKFTGAVQYRKQGGINNWVGESLICSAKKAIKINKWLTFANSRLYVIKLLFRRFYFDGQASGKFEIGFRIKTGWVKGKALEEIISEILSLNIRVCYGGDQEEIVPLGHAEEALAKQYFFNSSRNPVRSDFDPAQIVCSAPALVLSNHHKEEIVNPLSGRTIFLKELNAKLACYLLKISNRSIQLWQILNQNPLEAHNGSQKNAKGLHQKEIRDTRIILSRLIASKKSLNQILKWIKKGSINPKPRSEASNSVQFYLIETIKNTLKKEQELNNDSLTYLVRSVEDALIPGEINALYEKLKITMNVRPQVWSKVEHYFRQEETLRAAEKAELIMTKNEINISGGEHININQAGGDIHQDHGPKPSAPSPSKPSQPSGQTGLEIFVSYAWGGKSEALVDALEAAFKTRNMTLVRDKRDLGFKGEITEFMKRIGKGQAVVTVISDKYLKSHYCMFELLEIHRNLNFKDRIFPIVLEDADIFEPIPRLGYLKYWKDKKEELERSINDFGVDAITVIGDDYKIYKRIFDNYGEVVNILKDINTLTPKMLSENHFDLLLKELGKLSNSPESA
ncbi:toll/interleukin-1 receptor domain-containing protein [Pareuzebyella sediminis]|uniref:toll/interleukin-1 receptor domain-containing protein n=1 Tax=Pareuzebyella sediminis TaxID=2607998 RepID=UPI0011EC83A9|nr:toll/interleukin-1 receptor domain-containing protein [Pareuzebyella sediminis]